MEVDDINGQMMDMDGIWVFVLYNKNKVNTPSSGIIRLCFVLNFVRISVQLMQNKNKNKEAGHIKVGVK
jgi:hypothetical protein